MEDEWNFKGQSLFLRWGSFDALDSSVDLIIELICYTEVKKKLLAMSVCYTEVKLSTLKRETLTLNLLGGGP